MDSLDVVVEIPEGSRNKYEMDFEAGRIRWAERCHGSTPPTMATSRTRWGVLRSVGRAGPGRSPTFPGCKIRARAIGMLCMSVEKALPRGACAFRLMIPATPTSATSRTSPSSTLWASPTSSKVYEGLERGHPTKNLLARPAVAASPNGCAPVPCHHQPTCT